MIRTQESEELEDMYAGVVGVDGGGRDFFYDVVSSDMPMIPSLHPD